MFIYFFLAFLQYFCIQKRYLFLITSRIKTNVFLNRTIATAKQIYFTAELYIVRILNQHKIFCSQKKFNHLKIIDNQYLLLQNNFSFVKLVNK
jgi:hypothetical protein